MPRAVSRSGTSGRFSSPGLPWRCRSESAPERSFGWPSATFFGGVEWPAHLAQLLRTAQKAAHQPAQGGGCASYSKSSIHAQAEVETCAPPEQNLRTPSLARACAREGRSAMWLISGRGNGPGCRAAMARGAVGDVAPARNMKNPTGTLGGAAIKAGDRGHSWDRVAGHRLRVTLGPVAEKPAHAVT